MSFIMGYKSKTAVEWVDGPGGLGLQTKTVNAVYSVTKRNATLYTLLFVTMSLSPPFSHPPDTRSICGQVAPAYQESNLELQANMAVTALALAHSGTIGTEDSSTLAISHRERAVGIT